MLTTPQVTSRRDTGASGRRPASAASVGMRAAVRAGMQRRHGGRRHPDEDDRAQLRQTQRRSRRGAGRGPARPAAARCSSAAAARPSPTRAPTTPVTVPCSTSAARTVRGGRAAGRQLAERDELPASADRERGRDHDPDDGEHDRAEHEAPPHRLAARPSSRCWSRRTDSSRSVRLPAGCARCSSLSSARVRSSGRSTSRKVSPAVVRDVAVAAGLAGREQQPSGSCRQPTGSTSPDHGGRRARDARAPSSSPTSTPRSSRERGRRGRPRPVAVGARPDTRSWMPVGQRVVEREVGQLGVRTRARRRPSAAANVAVHGDGPRALGEPGRARRRAVADGVGLPVACAATPRAGVSASVRMRVTAMRHARPPGGRRAARPARCGPGGGAPPGGPAAGAAGRRLIRTTPTRADGRERSAAPRWPRRRCGRRA